MSHLYSKETPCREFFDVEEEVLLETVERWRVAVEEVAEAFRENLTMTEVSRKVDRLNQIEAKFKAMLTPAILRALAADIEEKGRSIR